MRWFKSSTICTHISAKIAYNLANYVILDADVSNQVGADKGTSVGKARRVFKIEAMKLTLRSFFSLGEKPIS